VKIEGQSAKVDKEWTVGLPQTTFLLYPSPTEEMKDPAQELPAEQGFAS
jgi:hypothetical protein